LQDIRAVILGKILVTVTFNSSQLSILRFIILILVRTKMAPRLARWKRILVLTAVKPDPIDYPLDPSTQRLTVKFAHRSPSKERSRELSRLRTENPEAYAHCGPRVPGGRIATLSMPAGPGGFPGQQSAQPDQIGAAPIPHAAAGPPFPISAPFGAVPPMLSDDAVVQVPVRDQTLPAVLYSFGPDPDEDGEFPY
jgi:hypothetical protein